MAMPNCQTLLKILTELIKIDKIKYRKIRAVKDLEKNLSAAYFFSIIIKSGLTGHD